MNALRFLHTIDGISTWTGKTAAWLIVGLMALVCAEVFKRYILNMPTAWIFDASNMLYGTLFMIGGAYTLAQNAHVRGDFLYSSMRPRMQAGLDLVLYIAFFLPGIAALAYAGWDYASDSRRIYEHSNVTADGPPVIGADAQDQVRNDAVRPIAGRQTWDRNGCELLARHGAGVLWVQFGSQDHTIQRNLRQRQAMQMRGISIG